MLTEIQHRLGTTEDTRIIVRAAFGLIDKNGDGKLSRIEVIKALRNHERVCKLLQLPQFIRQEDGTRDQFEAAFQRIDSDDSKDISLTEFENYFIPPDHSVSARSRGIAFE